MVGSAAPNDIGIKRISRMGKRGAGAQLFAGWAPSRLRRARRVAQGFLQGTGVRRWKRKRRVYGLNAEYG